MDVSEGKEKLDEKSCSAIVIVPSSNVFCGDIYKKRAYSIIVARNIAIKRRRKGENVNAIFNRNNCHTLFFVQMMYFVKFSRIERFVYLYFMFLRGIGESLCIYMFEYIHM